MNANLVIVVAASLVLAACGATTPERLDSQMGTSLDMLKARQTVNPQASADSRPVEGIDGKAADALVDRYHKSVSQPQKAGNIYTIGVGGSGSGGATMNR